MNWPLVVISTLVLVVSGYMVVDGVHALRAGDYITPRSGSYAGQLGPWSRVVAAVGIPPRSLGMKIAFVAYGLAYLAVGVLCVLGVVPAAALIVVAALGLWYLPFGTILNAVVILLLLLG